MSKNQSMRWTVIGKGSRDGFTLCECVCGTKREVNSRNLKYGSSKSCGCTISEGVYRHGSFANPEYRIWQAIKERCGCPGHKSYKDYGGRGIRVCQRWAIKKGFVNFLADMGQRPTPQHTIDRKDNDKGYWCGKAECPECGPLGREPNCHWVTQSENARNRRSVRLITYAGETLCVAEWAERAGFVYDKLHYWIRKYGEQEALRRAFAPRIEDVDAALSDVPGEDPPATIRGTAISTGLPLAAE